jgi:hypothetical protein
LKKGREPEWISGREEKIRQSRIQYEICDEIAPEVKVKVKVKVRLSLSLSNSYALKTDFVLEKNFVAIINWVGPRDGLDAVAKEENPCF